MNQAIFFPNDCFEIKGKGIVITGSLQSGFLRKGMKTTVNSIEAKVIGIEAFRKTLDQGVSSTDKVAQSIGVLVTNLRCDDIKSFAIGRQSLVFIPAHIEAGLA